MGKVNLCNTLDTNTETLLKNIGFTYVGENDELLAAYADDYSVLVYDTRYPYLGIIKYWDLEGERDEFLMACVAENAEEKFPDVYSDIYGNVAQMLYELYDMIY